MKKEAAILTILIGCLLTVGCAAFVVGAGAGAGVYTYMNGQLTRSYQAMFERTNQACVDTLKSLKIEIMEETSDGICSMIKAKRTDQTPVTIKTVMIAPKITEVSIRSGIIGIWDKKVSELIHASIAQSLQE